ncbi:hypothetical protein [Phenylobacterium aquaticum]|uniref:hypothetical protein n=1 Tax=Phenylobacterium aquaticum TaxID=1763816 RepID=UPI0026EEA57C|nr:hypothetical protein [Phenylobacterium aquaticum]
MPIQTHHVDRTLTVLRRLGFSLATDPEIEAGRAAAVQLVGEAIATADTLRRVQARTGCACFVARADEGFSAAVSAIPLTPLALPDLAKGQFDALAPLDALVARPGDPVAAIYIWGAAGLSWRGRMLAVAAAQALVCEVHPTLPSYARAATSEGEHILQHRLGARPVRGPGGLVMAPPHHPQRRAA